MVKLVYCVLQVMISFSCVVCSGSIKVHNDGIRVDGGRRFQVYICTAAGEIGDGLTWYHTIGGSNTALSGVTQTDTKSGNMNITLNLILAIEYNNTYISCAKTTSRSNPQWIWSKSILVTFTEASEPDVEPFVTVTPDTSPVYFEANGTSTFVCNGSKPLVGRKLVWFIQGPDSKPVYANKQIYDSKTNVNNLVLRYNESYNEGVLYCAQSLVFHHVNAQEQFYDVAKESTVRSKNITLVQRIIEDNNENRSDDKGILGYADNNRPRDKVFEGDPKGNSDLTDASNTDENKDDLVGSSPLVYAIPSGVVALLLVLAAAVWLYRRRRAPVKTPGNDECIYATPEVQYVTLDFQSATKDAPTQESSPYAEIIGIYKPNNTRKPQ